MEQSGVYVKVGVFVLIFFLLILGAIVMLGGGLLGKREAMLETYVSESVQGLDVGAAVKYRGVPVGSVKRIGFVRSAYQIESQAIRIVMALDLDKTDVKDDEFLEERLDVHVANGMRVRIASGGLTGAMYLEIDYMSESEQEWPEPLEVKWEPKHYHLPSAPSTMARLQKGIDEILEDFSTMNLTGTMEEIRGLVVDLRKGLAHDVGPTVKNLEEFSAKLPPAVDDITNFVKKDLKGDVDRLTDSITGVVDNDVKRLVADLNTNVNELSSSIDKLVRHLDDSMTREVDPALANIAKASEDLPGVMADIRRSLRRLDRLTDSQAAQIEGVLTNVRALSGDIRTLVELIKRQPSGAIFGGPPPRVRKEGK